MQSNDVDNINGQRFTLRNESTRGNIACLKH